MKSFNILLHLCLGIQYIFSKVYSRCKIVFNLNSWIKIYGIFYCFIKHFCPRYSIVIDYSENNANNKKIEVKTLFGIPNQLFLKLQFINVKSNLL